MPGKVINPERNAQIIAMRRAGKLPREISEVLGVTRSVVGGVTHRAGLSTPGLQYLCQVRGDEHPSTKIPDAELPIIRARYQPRSRTDGAKAMAREYGVDIQTIWGIASGRLRAPIPASPEEVVA